LKSYTYIYEPETQKKKRIDRLIKLSIVRKHRAQIWQKEKKKKKRQTTDKDYNNNMKKKKKKKSRKIMNIYIYICIY